MILLGKFSPEVVMAHARGNSNMNIVVLTNDNLFSFLVLQKFLEQRQEDIKLVVFSSALIGKRGLLSSVIWLVRCTGIRHTGFKLLVYGAFRIVRLLCWILPFLHNRYSSRLWAKRNRIPGLDAADVNRAEIIEQVRLVNPDLIVSVSMNQIVKKELLEMPAKGCMNVHCAPLPLYGGMSPYVWALANDESHSAATIHYMEEGLDEGDIIVQEKESVLEGDSAFSLFYRCCLRARELLPKVVDDIEEGTVTSYPQDLSKKTYFSWPDKKCIRSLRANRYSLAKFRDFAEAVFQRAVRLSEDSVGS